MARRLRTPPASLLLVGPPQRSTLLARTFEVTIRDVYGTTHRLVRARRPEDALRFVQAELQYAQGLNADELPATVRRLDTRETWEKPQTPSAT